MKTLLFLGLFMFSTSIYGQDYLLNKIGGSYCHLGKEYGWKELGEVYTEYEESLNIYSNGRRNFKSAKMLVIGGGLLIGGGYISYKSGTRDFVKSFGSTIIAFGVFAELGALVFIIEGTSKLSKAKREFNFEMLKRYGYKSDVSLAFGSTSNGLSLIFQF